MILYHTSDREIQQPDICRGRKNADFGQGFYLTPDRDFTYRWAWKDAVVNEYEFDEAGLLIQRFSRSPEWFETIFRNRRMEDSLTADAVRGARERYLSEGFADYLSKPVDGLQLEAMLIRHLPAEKVEIIREKMTPADVSARIPNPPEEK